jgi:hypothetical protein
MGLLLAFAIHGWWVEVIEMRRLSAGMTAFKKNLLAQLRDPGLQIVIVHSLEENQTIQGS